MPTESSVPPGSAGPGHGKQRALQRDDAVHVWLDIEDDSDWLGEMDVETLPTLLVLHEDRPMFFGPVLPHIDVVDRTLRALGQHGPAGQPVPDEHRESVARVIDRLRNGRGTLRAIKAGRSL